MCVCVCGFESKNRLNFEFISLFIIGAIWNVHNSIDKITFGNRRGNNKIEGFFAFVCVSEPIESNAYWWLRVFSFDVSRQCTICAIKSGAFFATSSISRHVVYAFCIYVILWVIFAVFHVVLIARYMNMVRYCHRNWPWQQSQRTHNRVDQLCVCAVATQKSIFLIYLLFCFCVDERRRCRHRIAYFMCSFVAPLRDQVDRLTCVQQIILAWNERKSKTNEKNK